VEYESFIITNRYEKIKGIYNKTNKITKSFATAGEPRNALRQMK